MSAEPESSPKRGRIELLRSWQPYEGDFEIRDIEPYQRLATYFLGLGRPVDAIKALRKYGMPLKAAREMVDDMAAELPRMAKEFEGS
jgi:hypothetical protein